MVTILSYRKLVIYNEVYDRCINSIVTYKL